MTEKKLDPIIKASGAIKDISANGEITGVWTTGGTDRDGDILDIGGWDLTEFERNPIMLYGHEARTNPPIGTVKRVWFEGNQGLFTGSFSSIPFAQNIRTLYQEGVLKTFSHRFNPIEWTYMNDANGYPQGRHFTRQALMEISAVPLPANVDAEILAVKSGLTGKSAEDALRRIEAVRDITRKVYSRASVAFRRRD